ncbi:GTP-binding protein [Actinotalea sp. K2]|uniref:CobW family GTP-binding protein n=1 Tax=Actinotalea sp. K2 TaxID=2939438 RepID=UPI002016C929|nr:GTP-binding protein [Actinotalea sp. K2]MCL3862379.1 GTP-binding protein [Actinotalea sp. K2]
MTAPLPLVVLTTIDPVLRDTAVAGMLTDAPGVVVLRHDITDGPGGGGLRRLVLDAHGVVEDQHLPLEHACLSCAVREDAVPALRRLADDGRWGVVVLTLPVSAESLPVTRQLGSMMRRGGELSALRVASIVNALDLGAVEHDILGDDLLAERGLALTADDRRSVGEALVAQLGHADVVVVSGEATDHPIDSDLVDHLRAPDGVRVEGTHLLDLSRLVQGRHDSAAGEQRLDPLRARAAHGPTDNGVWSIELRSSRPLHPERLVDQVERLGSGRLRSRGVFWVPTRPHSACIWDGAGGQLAVGQADSWAGCEPFTRLVYTGTGGGAEIVRLRQAFEDILVSEAEMTEGLVRWLGREDVLSPWLGEQSEAC